MELAIERLAAGVVIVDDGDEFSLRGHAVDFRLGARYTWAHRPRVVPACQLLVGTCHAARGSRTAVISA
jgi:hypothetical protein